jgi:hypothetical protein
MNWAISQWQKFWFSPVSLLNLAVMRVLLATNLFFNYLSRHSVLQELFTDEGLVSREAAYHAIREARRPLIPLYIWPDSLVSWVHGALLIALVLMALGVGGRLMIFICYLITLAFNQRNVSATFGIDNVSLAFLLFLSGTQASSRLSIFRSGSQVLSTDFLTPICYRLIQIQLCAIYFWAGFEKLLGQPYWEGTAIWLFVANSQFKALDFTWLRHVPWFIYFATYTTVAFELVIFPVGVWFKRFSRPILFAGLGLHMAIATMGQLLGLSLAMLAPYFLFTDCERELAIIRQRWKKIASK